MTNRRNFLLAPLLLLLLIPLLRVPAPVQAASAVSRILLDGEVLTPRDAIGK